ncbi:hypothetical protein QUF31_17140 [Dickeya chrysanthemi]|uniref:hypothetical protein n=1 Tax=Dickeya chrysanthemi TaxID=556 RepID=UPI0025A0E597|nr:hypothetical protein [Dickeya chrysanthemi]WJM84829.1 hypothetical protein QUF31_17140 [Dickeya chrysanthemi]
MKTTAINHHEFIATTEVFSGSAFSYEYEQAGFVISLNEHSVLLFDKNRSAIYGYVNIMEINYSLSFNKINNAIITIITDDHISPEWIISVPSDNKYFSSQQICERWVEIFNENIFPFSPANEKEIKKLNSIIININ